MVERRTPENEQKNTAQGSGSERRGAREEPTRVMKERYEAMNSVHCGMAAPPMTVDFLGLCNENISQSPQEEE